jgi:PUA-domain protein
MNELRIKSRHQLRKSQHKEMINKIKDFFEDADVMFKKNRFEVVNTDDYELLLIDGRPLFFIIDSQPFFTVQGALELQPKKRLVTVDAGAVPFVVKGADIMKPGIVSADPDINEGDMVIIIEKTHGKPLAIGRALVSGDQMTENSGKAIKTIHRVGDKLWNVQL